MIRIKNLSLLLTFFMLACSSNKENQSIVSKGKQNLTLYVASYQVDCVGVGPQKCPLIREKPVDEWQNLYSGIKDFQYEEGYEYLIKVRKEQAASNMMDASNIEYKLVEVVSKNKVKVEVSPLYDSWGLMELNGEKVDVINGANAEAIEAAIQKIAHAA